MFKIKRFRERLMVIATLVMLPVVGVMMFKAWAEHPAEQPVSGAEHREYIESLQNAASIERPVIAPVEQPAHAPVTEPTYTYFDVPLDKDLQEHIFRLCEEYGIDPAIILAMCRRESNYRFDAAGDSGNSKGVMQIQERWHKARMERLDVTDLFNPYQNVAVGIDYLGELLESYDGDMSMALVAYNAGPSGAYTYWFSQGEYANDYSRAVLETADALNAGRGSVIT